MWRRTYLLLLLVRLWFALSPSYLHPDENFQGPEVIAGKAAPLRDTPVCASQGYLLETRFGSLRPPALMLVLLLRHPEKMAC